MAPASSMSISRGCQGLNSWATSAPKQPQHQQKLLLPPDLHGSSAATEVSLLCTPFIISERGTDSWPLRDSITNPCLTSLSDKPGSQPQRPPEHLKCQKEKNELQTGEALQTTPNPDSSPWDKEWKTGHCAVVAFLPTIEWKLDQQNWQLWKTRLVV